MRTVSRDIVGAFIFSKDNFVLLGKNAPGGVYEDVWVVPGGGIEPGESMREALLREVNEEVGIDISGNDITEIKLSLKGTSQKTLKENGERVNVKMNFYNYKINLPEAANKIAFKLEDDLIEARWFSMTELSALRFSPSVERVLLYLRHL